ncbi:MAG: hypothetical protein A3G21_20475 [Acidobacteria bacterium RIFCSPLOWO2_12_FULL_66_21]|nr:MAG: hypothetical protein A3G21_20475 [Acidobacteria bacterium RIFCSPLOWO2_12_FULL_66_21]
MHGYTGRRTSADAVVTGVGEERRLAGRAAHRAAGSTAIRIGKPPWSPNWISTIVPIRDGLMVALRV